MPELSVAVGGAQETAISEDPDGMVANVSAGQLLITGGSTSPENKIINTSIMEEFHQHG